MENIKISVVIPVYNGEKFIKKCLKSVLTQTYKNTEIVIVNDGSKDNSLEICNRIASTDSRVKVISQPNGGSAKARRVGISHATGDYVTFVDVDDFYCRQDAIEIMSGYIEKYHTDVVQYDFERKLHYVKKVNRHVQSVNVADREEFMTNHFPSLLGSYYEGSLLSASLYDKIYKRELFDKALSADNTKHIFMGDDVYLNLHILENAASVCFIPEVLYTYQATVGGTSRFNARYMEDYQVVKDNQLDFISKYKDEFQWKQDMEYYCHAETAWCVYAQSVDIARCFQKEDALDLIFKCFEYDWVRRTITYFESTEIKDTYAPTLQKIQMLLNRNAQEYYAEAVAENKRRRLKNFLRKFL